MRVQDEILGIMSSVWPKVKVILINCYGAYFYGILYG